MTGYDSFVEKVNALATLEAGRGYLDFLSHVVVDAQPRKRPFRQIAEDWQWDRAVRSAPAVDYAAAIASEPPRRLSFWNGYHKGSDKTHDTARELCFLLGWSKRRLNIVICAGSEDQAQLITTAIRGILNDNPWVAERVWVTDLTAGGDSGSELSVLPMKAYTSQGVFPDYVVAEEVTHWQHDEGKKFWDFILSSVNKRPGCVLKVNTNAGHVGSWQWNERNRVAKSPYWSFYEAPVGKPLPNWMNQDKIDDDSQGMSPGERDRLYKNRWVDPGEEHGYLDIAACMRCRDDRLEERTHGERYVEYFAVIDYGSGLEGRDRTSLAVMHATTVMTDITRVGAPEGKKEWETGVEVVVDRLDCWMGTAGNRIPINIPENEDGSLDYNARSVEGWLEVTMKNFRITHIVVDPHQLEGLAIKYERRGRRVERFKWRRGQNNHRMAQLLKAFVENRKVRWSPEAGYLPGVEDDTLEKEMSRLVIKDMIYGYKFDHESGRHDDRSFVVAAGITFAIPVAKPTVKRGVEPFGGEPQPAPMGAKKSVVALNGDDQARTWNLFGVNGPSDGGLSAWHRGDISGRR